MSGSAWACACSARSVSSRRWADENGRNTMGICASSRRMASRRSRRLRADSKPSMAEAATPATEVPNDRPRPLMGAASAARIDSRLDDASSAKTAPWNVTTMPRKVPSMPSMTSRPTRYGVRAGPGSATRSPSMRWRTGLRSAGAMRPSQPARSEGGSAGPPARAAASDVVAARYCRSSCAPSTYTAPITTVIASASGLVPTKPQPTQPTAARPTAKIAAVTLLFIPVVLSSRCGLLPAAP